MEFIQSLLIILLASWMVIDQQGLVLMTWFPVMISVPAGLIMGDMTTALMIGGTFQLMNLGVANIGGSSVPNWGLAALVGIYVACRTTSDLESAKAVALAVGVPVGMLGIQLDVLAKLINTYVANAAKKACDALNFKKMERILWLGPVVFILSTAIPTALCILFGEQIVNFILESVPEWFTNGLSIAGNMLPVVGIALLLQVMPTKKFLSMLMLGFVFSAYLNIPMLGVSIVGFALAYYYFTTQNNKPALAADQAEVTEEGDDWDE
ncbi:PTS sugar transporter subunit IIC [Erysipelotrichaceae bacterium 51-3]|uniref:PTS mannose/fructose/sorbose/N-acetylgalactosamine transporter subunit IIC n=1 Tax=Allobaculum sp. JKK-2023 TaxID=3108943 RepID=UPI002B052EBF|nr:PTS sugar transporter subunit IIC [Allobaculum sp. JKK-2023]